jgi:uncharacterized protein (TIGR03437 family)
MGRLTTEYLRILSGVLLLAASLAAQTFDTSGNTTLHGDYFVREVLISGQDPVTGSLNSAVSAIGVATFDGKGDYIFAGQVTSSVNGTSSAPHTGTYQVSSSGLMNMTSLADPTDVVWGGVAALGPSAFVASATEGGNVDIMIAIPAGSNVTNSSLTGNYSVGTIDFLNANATMVREATFTLTPTGTGSLGSSVSVSGTAENLGGAPITQAVNGATYSLSGEGSGTASFGASSASMLLSGTKTFYMSRDGNIILGGSPTGFDLLVGIRSLNGPATNATANSLYYIAGLENTYDQTQSPPNSVDAFYGSANANGQGTTLFHNRMQSYLSVVYDYTFDAEYGSPDEGTITNPAALPWYQFTFGANGQAFLATGQQGLYSLVVGFGAPTFSSGSGVYLKPTGVVNSGNLAPITNPIAPGEFITLFGSGLSNQTLQESGLPFPSSLANVTVTIDGVVAPLYYVSSGQIEALVPSSIVPTTNPVSFATVQVKNNNVLSNPVMVYLRNTAPGVFALGGGGIGPAAAQHANFATITSSNPANVGETIIVYETGLGAVSPAVSDGAAASSAPLSNAVAPVYVDFGGVYAPLPTFAGLTPTAVGLYQINVGVPAGSGPGDTYFDISTPDAYTSVATVNILGSSGSARAFAQAPKTRPVRRMQPRGTSIQRP